MRIGFARMRGLCLAVLTTAFVKFALAQNTPRPLRPDITVKLFMSVETNCIRLEKDPSSGRLHYVRISGEIYEIDRNGPSKKLVSTTSDHGISSAAGFAISTTGTFFLVGNITQSNSNVGISKKGELQGNTRAWKTVAQTVPYPLNQAFNHNFNAIVLSPDERYLFVNSGVRTDHGEAQYSNGPLAGLRELPITTVILRLPSNTENLVLQNDETYLKNNGYQFARGVRNHFDLAFAPNGDLLGAENSGDRDDSEELNWIREGRHYGFPRRIGTNNTPQQLPGYNPDADPLVSRSSYAYGLGFFHNDPTYPPPPAGVVFTDPAPSIGPDADKFREDDGAIRDASNEGKTISTFTAHRSPLGLVFDIEQALSEEFAGDAFVLSFGTGSAALGDPSNDLLHLELNKRNEENYEVKATRIVENFSGGRFDRGPVDAVLLGNKMYVIETGAPNIWEITLPAKPTAVHEDAAVGPVNFSLGQNYPNPFGRVPFNPTTRIGFSLVATGKTSLRIYDLTGKLVQTIFEHANMRRGEYSVDVDMSRRPAGVYFYMLEQGNMRLTGKMSVIK